MNDMTMIRQKGYEALIKGLGTVGTVVFMKQFENGYGDYTAERHANLRDVSIDDIAASIRKRKNPHAE